MKYEYRIKEEVNKLGNKRYIPQFKREEESKYYDLYFENNFNNTGFNCSMNYLSEEVAIGAIKEHHKTNLSIQWDVESTRIIKVED